MSDPREALALAIRERAAERGYREVAREAGVSVNYVFRAASFGRESKYPPVLSDTLVSLLRALGLELIPSGGTVTPGDIAVWIGKLVEVPPERRELMIDVLRTLYISGR